MLFRVLSERTERTLFFAKRDFKNMPTVAERLSEIEKISAGIAELLRGRYADERRLTLSPAYLSLTLDHHHATIVLMKEQHYGSALLHFCAAHLPGVLPYTSRGARVIRRSIHCMTGNDRLAPTILLAENVQSSGFRKLPRYLFRDLGFRVLEAGNGLEAWHQARTCASQTYLKF